MSTAAAGGGPSIRALWTRILAGLCVVVLLLGTLSFGLAVMQRAMFADVTTQFQGEIGAFVELSRDLRSVERPMTAVFYQFGSEEQLRAEVATFNELAGRITEGFAAARAVAAPDADLHHLDDALTSWSEVVGAVRYAQARWGSVVVTESLAAGDDPFLDAWTNLSDTQESLGRFTASSVDRLRAQSDRADAQLKVLLPTLLGTIVLGLLIAVWAARRLTHRIITPVLRITAAARLMQAGDLSARVDPDPAAGELSELGRAINSLAESLQVSHGELHVQATTDPLTGLPNRRALQEHLDRRLAPGGSDNVALLFIDLDDFKIVNDTLGHAAGDDLLRAVSDRLRGCSRAGDLVARVGGDEFAIVIEPSDAPAMDVATGLAQRILDALAHPIDLEHGTTQACCSIGIAEVAPGRQAVEEILRNADVAMYVAKGRGKNCFEPFSDTTDTETLSGLALRRDLHNAAELDQLEVHYQPVVDVDSGALLGLEALVRWEHPTRGLLPPAEFIAVAEETGDIFSVGAWVLDRACRDLSDLLRSGTVGRSTWMSVNISAQQLSPDFVRVVRQTLARHDLAGGCLVLEITEPALATHPERAAAALRPLQSDGVRVAVDDFGTGCSPLQYLRALTIDVIKLDGAHRAEHDDGHAQVFEAMIGLGRSLGVSTIAVGIEEPDQLTRLHRLGHLGVQGYLIARPSPLAAIVARSSPAPETAPVGGRG